MGHLSNPVGLRLGCSHPWMIVGNDGRMSDKLHQLVSSAFKSKRIQRLGILYSHSIVHTCYKQYFTLYVYLYDFKWVQLAAAANDLYEKDVLESSSNLVIIRQSVHNTYNSIRLFLHKLILDELEKTFICEIGKVSEQLKIVPIPVINFQVSSQAIANFALRKLKSKNPLNIIFNDIMNNIAPYYQGMRITCSGRFTRNQRATRTVFDAGKVPRNTFQLPIDYTCAFIPLKFGVGTVKIWIGRTR